MTHPAPSRPVRVLHVIHHLQAGGMEYGLIKLVNGLVGGPIESIVCSTSTASPAMAALLHPDVRLIQLDRRPGNDPRLVWRLFQLFRRERPDIVHTHAWGTLVEGYVAARLARVPVVMHGEHGTLQAGPWQARVQRVVWSRVDRLLSVSSRLAERMADTVGVPLERITVVRNGVDLQRFSATPRQVARAAFDCPGDAVVLGHAGRLVPVKNQEALVQAAALLRERGLRFHVLIAGDGPLRDALAQQVTALDLHGCVHLLGHRGDVERLYAALDVYVLCSRSEGMPNTILEAMAAGVPVVATQVGGVDEVVVRGATGLLVPAGDTAALADALARLISDVHLRERMGAQARAHAERHFSVAAMVGGYQDAYLSSMRT
jgi:sugar transferase (PEP-CTERM/EpsH1 system associated)